eukprot:14710187-Ditylum_brightwellii.AAC.1
MADPSLIAAAIYSPSLSISTLDVAQFDIMLELTHQEDHGVFPQGDIFNVLFFLSFQAQVKGPSDSTFPCFPVCFGRFTLVRPLYIRVCADLVTFKYVGDNVASVP